MDKFRNVLWQVDRSYEGFVHAVVSYVKMPGNKEKQIMIEDYIKQHPQANSSDVLNYMLEETDFFDSVGTKERNDACITA